MTIFPTHKTELKTKLPRHEVIKKLENNDFYAPGFNYKLTKTATGHTLRPVHEEMGARNSGVPIVNMSISQKGDNTAMDLSFYPFKFVNIFTAIYLFVAFAIQLVLIITTVNTHSFNILHLLPTFLGGAVYLIGLIIFSVEVISIRKQIEKCIEAEINEVTEDEMSKLQSWYEKEREPFKFRQK